MALTKITSNLIGSNAIGAANITDDSITAADLEHDLALQGNPTATTQSAGNNTTRLATTAFVTTAINNIVDSAPANLDTLNEIAASMNDDATFNTTLVNLIAAKSPIASPTFTGDVTIPSKIIHDGDTDTYLRFSGADDFRIVVGNSTRAAYNTSKIHFNQEGINQDFQVEGEGSGNEGLIYADASTNRVGIGTTTPASHLDITSASSPTLQLKDTTNDVTLKAYAQDANAHVATVSNHPLLFDTNNTTALTLSTSQHATFTSRIVPGEHVIFNTSTGYLQFPTNSGSQAWAVGGSGGGVNPGVDRGDLGIHYWSGSAWTNKFMIDGATGNVGIGTASPGSKLHLTDTASNAIVQTTWENDARKWSFGVHGGLSDAMNLYDHTASASRFTITSDGKVGIGTTGPVYGLDVRSNGYFSTAASTVNLTLGDSTNGTTSGINTTNNELKLLPNGSTERLKVIHTNTASTPLLYMDSAHPWIDMVAPDGSVFKSGITMRGGASSTQAQAHFHLTRDSSYRTMSGAGNYDAYIDTTTSNTAYGHFLLGVNHVEVMHAHADTQQVTFPENSVFNVAKNNGYVQDGNWWICDYVHRNVGSDYSTSTGRYTAPEAGTYFFSASIMTHDSSSSASQVEWKFYKNTSAVKTFVQHKTGAYHTRVDGSIVLELDAGDYVRIYVGNSGTSTGWAGSQAEQNNWCGFLIG